MKARSVPAHPEAAAQRWALRLYVADEAVCSVRALDNLKKLCEERLPGRFRLEVVDLSKHPQQARIHQIVAVPTLVRLTPVPRRMVIGDLSDTERVLSRMGM